MPERKKFFAEETTKEYFCRRMKLDFISHHMKKSTQSGIQIEMSG